MGAGSPDRDTFSNCLTPATSSGATRSATVSGSRSPHATCTDKVVPLLLLVVLPVLGAATVELFRTINDGAIASSAAQYCHHGL